MIIIKNKNRRQKYCCFLLRSSLKAKSTNRELRDRGQTPYEACINSLEKWGPVPT
jgi:hypothetical protein